MARIILMFNDQVVKEYPLLEDSVTIGRNVNNTIKIDNLAVSGFHARIDAAGDYFILTDLQSTNGTFVNDKRIISHKLVHGDSVTIGKHAILFVETEKENEARQGSPKMDMDKTMILDTAKHKELLAKQKEVIQAEKKAEKVGVVNFIEGADLGEIVLKKKLTKIGKADTSEIRLSGIFMPATAATISRRPSGYVISCVGGKLKVNGTPVTDNIVLNDFDTIEIGKYTFQFYRRGTEEDH